MCIRDSHLCKLPLRVESLVPDMRRSRIRAARVPQLADISGVHVHLARLHPTGGPTPCGPRIYCDDRFKNTIEGNIPAVEFAQSFKLQ